jgi:hypothetical protein
MVVEIMTFWGRGRGRGTLSKNNEKHLQANNPCAIVSVSLSRKVRNI